MKLANARIVARIAEARDRLIHQRDNGVIALLIDNEPQDAMMKTAVLAAVVAEIDRRIDDLDADLIALEVELA